MKEYTVRVYTNRTEWRQNGELHRDDGPAIEYKSVTKEWYKHGKLHRDDGPAITRDGGTEEWYQNGKLHRLDGPAIIWDDGDKEYAIDGIYYSEEDYWKKVNPVKEMTIEEIQQLLGHKIKIIA